MREYTPIHEDKRLDDAWLVANGYQLGINAFYNAIRDASGRFNGYIVYVNHEPRSIKTLEEAEEVVRQRQQKRNNMASPIMKYFEYSHLPAHLQKVSMPIGVLAKLMDEELPDGPEKSAGLRKLLEAKDCLVRAALEKK